MENIRHIATSIANYLEFCRFDDVTDSSGYHVIKRFEDGTERVIEVYKSNFGTPHYVICCSYEDGDIDFMYTDGLSVWQLEDKLREFYMA